jgi:RHS repeat-associated protein
VATREGNTLRYVQQDSLGSTSVMSKADGTLDSSMTFFPFGGTRTGDVNTAEKFTGQELDSTGLYYYGARYYDATIGRFISADVLVQDQANPQALNRYTYCLNNPLRYTDPTGQDALDQYFIDRNITDPAIQNALRYLWSYLDADMQKALLQNTSEVIFLDPSDTQDCNTSWNEIDAIYINKKWKDLSKEKLAVYISHELRHRYQARMYYAEIRSGADKMSFDVLKYLDREYCEWDAHKYSGDLDDKLGTHLFYLPLNLTCFLQKLDLEHSYRDYKRARARFRNWIWGCGGMWDSGFYHLTENDYKNRK